MRSDVTRTALVAPLGAAGRTVGRREHSARNGRPAPEEDRMSTVEAMTLEHVVDMARYPLSQLGSAEGRTVVSRARRELLTLGCTVLPDFILPSLRDVLRQECSAMAPRA